MKKSMVMVAAALLCLVFGIQAQAASSANYTLVITITTDNIDIAGPWADGSWIALGGIGVNSQKHTKDFGSPTAAGNWTFNNVGASTVDLRMSVTALTQNGWAYLASGDPGATQPGSDQYRMSAIFTQWDRATLAYGDFDANDTLTATPTLCSGTQFAYDAETDLNFKGHTLSSGQARNMFLLVEVGPRVAATAGNITPVIQIAAVAH